MMKFLSDRIQLNKTNLKALFKAIDLFKYIINNRAKNGNIINITFNVECLLEQLKITSKDYQVIINFFYHFGITHKYVVLSASNISLAINIDNFKKYIKTND